MNNHINNFKNRIIVILALLPSLVMAQEFETKIFDFGIVNLEMHGQPAVSEKSTNDKKNTIFYQVDITINNAKLHPDQGVTQTNIYAEKVEMFLVDTIGRPQTIILQNATIENNIMSAFAKEAMILSEFGTIKFMTTDKVEIQYEGKESDILNDNNSKNLSGSSTTYSCQNGKIHENGKPTANSRIERCDNGVTLVISCVGNTMTMTHTSASFCANDL